MGSGFLSDPALAGRGVLALRLRAMGSTVGSGSGFGARNRVLYAFESGGLTCSVQEPISGNTQDCRNCGDGAAAGIFPFARFNQGNCRPGEPGQSSKMGCGYARQLTGGRYAS